MSRDSVRGATPPVDSYPLPGDDDEDWTSGEYECLHGVPWGEECLECELEDDGEDTNVEDSDAR